MGAGQGSTYLTKSCWTNTSFRRAWGERAGKSPPEWRRLCLVRDITRRCCGLADTARNDGAAGQYHTTRNGDVVGGVAPPEQLAIMVLSLTPRGENLCLPVLIVGILPTHEPAAASVITLYDSTTSARTLNAAQRLPRLTLTKDLFPSEGAEILPGMERHRKHLRLTKKATGWQLRPALTLSSSFNPRYHLFSHTLPLRYPVRCCGVGVPQPHANQLNQAGGIAAGAGN